VANPVIYHKTFQITDDTISTLEKLESFKLTEQSLENLKSEGLLDDVIDKLETIKNQEFTDEEKFLEILKSTIGDEQTVIHKSLILKHAKKQLIPQSILEKLSDLVNHEPIRGRKDFLTFLEENIGKDETEKYKWLILEHSEHYKDRTSFEVDPIIKEENADYFFKTVIRCLRSFVNNELLRLPEIFFRLRIVVVRDTKEDQSLLNNNALCETIDPFNEIIAPRLDVEIVDTYLRSFPAGYQLNKTSFDQLKGNLPDEIFKKLGALKGKFLKTKDDEFNKTLVEAVGENEADKYKELIWNNAGYFNGETDVIMITSASEEFIRSSARFTEEEDDQRGEEFTYHNNSETFNRKHAFYAKKPGVAAIWAGDDRLKTPVHEFAHAMSSIENGPIVDEYDDRGEGLFEFMVNKQFREESADPIPTFFAKYALTNRFSDGCVEYCSDRTRADKEPTWRSYVPEKLAPKISSIMDIAYYEYRFGKLVFNFMYDRLLAKLNRD
jgi:hypothetical protein